MSESKPRWEMILTRQAEKTLYRLSKNLLRQLDQALLTLFGNPRPPESQLLAGYDNLYRLPVEEWRITYTVEDERFIILILEIAPKQQPERYRLEEELEGLSPDMPSQPDPIVVPPIEELRQPFLSEPSGRIEGGFFPGGSSLLKRIRKEKIRLLIGDPFVENRENLRKLLFGESEIEIVGLAANGNEAIQMAAEQQPDVVLLDTHLSGIDGLTVCERITQQLPSAQIIMMSVHGEADYFRRAMLAGAKEFLIKPFSGLELATSIRRVYRAAALQRLHDPRLASRLPDTFSDLKTRIRVKLLAELNPGMGVWPPEKVRQLIMDRFDRILAQENIILSRPERERLFEGLVAEIQAGHEQQTIQPETRQFQANGSFKIGQKVRIIEGPFEDFLGTVDKVDPNQATVKVQISFFGQEKLVEFDFSQVEQA